MRADRAHQALRQDGLDRGGDKKRFDPHIDQTRKRAGRVVRVQRAENQMAGQRRADGNFRGFQVADFADHDHVRILAQNVTQTHREGQPDIRPHRDLVDSF